MQSRMMSSSNSEEWWFKFTSTAWFLFVWTHELHTINRDVLFFDSFLKGKITPVLIRQMALHTESFLFITDIKAPGRKHSTHTVSLHFSESEVQIPMMPQLSLTGSTIKRRGGESGQSFWVGGMEYPVSTVNHGRL